MSDSTKFDHTITQNLTNINQKIKIKFVQTS